MKKKAIGIAVLICVFAAAYLVLTGFVKRTDVMLLDYAASEDAISLKVGVSSSVGYVRAAKDDGGGVKPHYLTFYSAFGGINGSLGAVDTVTVELEPDDTEIYFYRGDGGYELVLQKAETGEWTRPVK